MDLLKNRIKMNLVYFFACGFDIFKAMTDCIVAKNQISMRENRQIQRSVAVFRQVHNYLKRLARFYKPNVSVLKSRLRHCSNTSSSKSARVNSPFMP